MNTKEALQKLSPLLTSSDIETVKQGLILWESLFDEDEFVNSFELYTFWTAERFFKLFKKGHFLPKHHHSKYISYWIVMQLYASPKVRASIEPITEMTLIFQNDFPDIPDNICNLKDLQSLTIYNVQYCSGLAPLNNLPSLEKLCIMNGNVNEKIDLLGHLPSLRSLTLLNTKLQTLPTSLCSFTQLRELNLTNNRISQIPKEIGNLTNLEYLYLNFDRHYWWGRETISQLPNSIGRLTKLKRLNLMGHKLSSLPKTFGNLEELRYLKIQGQELTILPESLSRCTKLQYLNLQGCKLQSLPQNMGDFQDLQTLLLSNNQLSALPGSICQLTQFHDWNLQNNKLTTLPTDFGRLPLRNVHLKNNVLQFLPESLGSCTSLEILDVSQNRLNELPAWACSLPQTAKIDWQKNRLQKVPNNWTPEQNPNINVDYNKMFFNDTSRWGMHKIQRARSYFYRYFTVYESSPWQEYHPYDNFLAAFINSFLPKYKTQQMRYVAKKGATRRQFTTPERNYVEGSWYSRKRRYLNIKPIQDPNLTDMRGLIEYRVQSGKKLTSRDIHQSVRDQIAYEYGSRLIPFTPSLINRITRIMFHMLIPFCMDPLLLGKSGICIRNFGTFRGIQKGSRTFIAFRASSKWGSNTKKEDTWSKYEDEFEHTRIGNGAINVMNFRDLRSIVYWSLVYNGYKWHDSINVSKEFVSKIFTIIFDSNFGIIPAFLGASFENKVQIKGWGTLSRNNKDNNPCFVMSKSTIKIEKKSANVEGT
jgi:Leucine-rich repeat (LRR) protein